MKYKPLRLTKYYNNINYFPTKNKTEAGKKYVSIKHINNVFLFNTIKENLKIKENNNSTTIFMINPLISLNNQLGALNYQPSTLNNRIIDISFVPIKNIMIYFGELSYDLMEKITKCKYPINCKKYIMPYLSNIINNVEYVLNTKKFDALFSNLCKFLIDYVPTHESITKNITRYIQILKNIYKYLKLFNNKKIIDMYGMIIKSHLHKHFKIFTIQIAQFINNKRIFYHEKKSDFLMAYKYINKILDQYIIFEKNRSGNMYNILDFIKNIDVNCWLKYIQQILGLKTYKFKIKQLCFDIDMIYSKKYNNIIEYILYSSRSIDYDPHRGDGFDINMSDCINQFYELYPDQRDFIGVCIKKYMSNIIRGYNINIINIHIINVNNIETLLKHNVGKINFIEFLEYIPQYENLDTLKKNILYTNNKYQIHYRILRDIDLSLFDYTHKTNISEKSNNDLSLLNISALNPLLLHLLLSFYFYAELENIDMLKSMHLFKKILYFIDDKTIFEKTYSYLKKQVKTNKSYEKLIRILENIIVEKRFDTINNSDSKKNNKITPIIKHKNTYSDHRISDDNKIYNQYIEDYDEFHNFTNREKEQIVNSCILNYINIDESLEEYPDEYDNFDIRDNKYW